MRSAHAACPPISELSPHRTFFPLRSCLPTIYILAADIPITTNKIVHTTGKSHGGGASGGCLSAPYSRRKRSRNRNDVHPCFADFFRFHKRFLSTLFICTRSCISKTPGGSDLPPLLLIQVQLPSALFEILLIYMPDCRKSACILLKKVIKYRCLIFVPCIRMRFCRVCSAFCGFSFNRIQPHTRQIRQGGVTKWVSFVKYAVRAQ